LILFLCVVYQKKLENEYFGHYTDDDDYNVKVIIFFDFMPFHFLAVGPKNVDSFVTITV